MVSLRDKTKRFPFRINVLSANLILNCQKTTNPALSQYEGLSLCQRSIALANSVEVVSVASAHAISPFAIAHYQSTSFMGVVCRPKVPIA